MSERYERKERTEFENFFFSFSYSWKYVVSILYGAFWCYLRVYMERGRALLANIYFNETSLYILEHADEQYRPLRQERRFSVLSNLYFKLWMEDGWSKYWSFSKAKKNFLEKTEI